jgi:hypothetical protein
LIRRRRKPIEDPQPEMNGEHARLRDDIRENRSEIRQIRRDQVVYVIMMSGLIIGMKFA